MGRLRLWLDASSQRVGTDANRSDHMQWSRAPACPLLQVPPALNRFSKAMDKNSAATLFKLLLKYKPEDKAAKKERLLEEAKSRTDGKQVGSFRPVMLPVLALSAAWAPKRTQSSGALDKLLEGRPPRPSTDQHSHLEDLGLSRKGQSWAASTWDGVQIDQVVLVHPL